MREDEDRLLETVAQEVGGGLGLVVNLGRRAQRGIAYQFAAEDLLQFHAERVGGAVEEFVACADPVGREKTQPLERRRGRTRVLVDESENRQRLLQRTIRAHKVFDHVEPSQTAHHQREGVEKSARERVVFEGAGETQQFGLGARQGYERRIPLVPAGRTCSLQLAA